MDKKARIIKSESEIMLAALDVVFGAKSPEELRSQTLATVFGHPKWQALPKFRRERVDAYMQGGLDTIARIYGKTPVVHAEDLRPPKAVAMLQPDATWHRHAHGGGWVAHTAYVERTAYVGPQAIVFQDARVLGHSRIYGRAQVYGQAEVYGGAIVRGDSHVMDGAQIYESASITGQSKVGGNARVLGNARINSASLVLGDHVGDGRLAELDQIEAASHEPSDGRITILPPAPLDLMVSPLSQLSIM